MKWEQNVTAPGDSKELVSLGGPDGLLGRLG